MYTKCTLSGMMKWRWIINPDCNCFILKEFFGICFFKNKREEKKIDARNKEQAPIACAPPPSIAYKKLKGSQLYFLRK